MSAGMLLMLPVPVFSRMKIFLEFCIGDIFVVTCFVE